MQSNEQKVVGQAALAELTQLKGQALTNLSQQDPDRYQQLHEEALAHLDEQVIAGVKDVEATWTAVYERLANLFFARDTPALLKLTVTAANLPLQTAQALQTRQYFQAVAYFRQAEYSASEETFSALLKAPNLDINLQAKALNARSVVYRVTGHLEAAMDGYRASLQLWQTIGNLHYQGIVYLNLGIISYNLRHYEDANDYLQQAETFFQKAGSIDWQHKTESELGLVQRDLGNWEKALAYFNAYIAHSEAQEAWEDVGVGEINRGEVLLFQGNLAEAKTALQRALQLTVSRTYRIDPLLYLGLAHQAAAEWEQAETYYKEALNLALEIDRREILPHVYFYLGDLLRRQGQDEAALNYWQEAAEVIQQTRKPLQDESLKISLLGRWQQVYEALVLHCLALGREAEAFAWAERARAQAFAEGVAIAGERPFADNIISLPKLQATIPTNTTLLSYFTTGVLEQDMPLLQAIPANNPLREHILTSAKTICFAITSTATQVNECPIDPNLFATHSPRGFDANRFLKPAVLQRLHNDLIGSTKETHFIIIPHGPLHRVPFTALLSLNEKKVTLQFAPSGTIYARQRESLRVGEGKTAVSCFAVGYNQIEASRHLKYATEEARFVAHMMGGQAAVDGALSKAKLQHQATTSRYLHFACHGYFDDADPLASYVLVGPDERLTARDVLDNWSLQADLVTLSACETGMSQILRGDEPMGLVRAFLYAGAKDVLVTQWPVDDLATFLLMRQFYKALQTNPTDLPFALAQAQRWLQEVTAVTIHAIMQAYEPFTPPAVWSKDAKPFAAPEYWAGFILVGA